MKKPTKRETTIALIKKAGMENDQQALMRAYTENRISYEVAIKAFRDGQKFTQAEGVKP